MGEAADTLWFAREALAVQLYESRQRFLAQSQAVDHPDAPYVGQEWTRAGREVRQAWRSAADEALIDMGDYMTPPDEFRGS